MTLRKQRISENEYNAAVVVWTYGRLVKSQVDEAVRQGTGVINFANMTVPHSAGYRVSLELEGYNFRVIAVPATYNKTGRLSFSTDTTLTVRAADKSGEATTDADPEYTGESSAD
jgi:hypothetical protein